MDMELLFSFGEYVVKQIYEGISLYQSVSPRFIKISGNPRKQPR